jgi:hypothetical protein
VVDTLVPASGVDLLVAPPASGVFWGLPLAGAFASVSPPLAAMPFAPALASSEEAPLSAAAAGATEASSPWFAVPEPNSGPLADWAQAAANAAQSKAANASRVVDRAGMAIPPRDCLML